MPNKDFPESFKYALAGLIYALRTQRNLTFHLLAALVVFGLSYYLKLSTTELLFVISAVFLVIISEMINTAIEAVVDLVTSEFHPLAKTAKDVAAGAVLTAAIYALIVGLVIFAPRLVYLLTNA